MFRFTTAGESHGPALLATVEGVPAVRMPVGRGDAPAAVGRSSRGPIRGNWWMGAAAAVLIAASGVAYGRHSAGAPVLSRGQERPARTTADEGGAGARLVGYE